MNKAQVEMLGRLGVSEGGGKGKARVLNKYTLYLNPNDKSLTPCLVRDGYWESWVTAWVYNNVEPGSVFFDVGAHSGYYTMLAADLVGPRGTVFAFEPNPYMAQLIIDSVQVNEFKNVHVYPKALGNKIGSTTLYLPEYLTGSASTVNAISDRFGTRRLRVPIEPMGEYVRLVKSTAPLVIKIDAEGAEEDIVESAIVQLTYYDNVILLMEYTPRAYTSDFLPTLRNFGEVKLLDTESRERDVSDDWLEKQEDWVTIVVRHRV